MIGRMIGFALVFYCNLMLGSTLAHSEECEKEFHRWKKFERQAQEYGENSIKAGVAASQIGSAFGGLGGFVGVPVGTVVGGVAARYGQMARDAKRDYTICLERVRSAAGSQDENVDLELGDIEL